MRGIGRRLSVVLATAAALIAIAPASALALGFGSVSVTPADPQAGAHSNVDIAINFSSAADDVKNLTIALPPGLVGDPNATPYCSVSDLNANHCPANTKVGTASTMVTLLSLLPNPLPVTGTLYNVQPQPGEPARFGIALQAVPLPDPLSSLVLPPIILQSGVSLRQTDFGLNTVINGIPNSATLVNLLGLPLAAPIDITSMHVTLLGTAPGTGKPFARNPSSCGSHTTNFSATSYSGSTTSNPATGHASFDTTGCAAEDFSPAFTAEVGGPGQTTNGVPTTARTAILQDPDEAGLHDAVVRIPSDLNPSATVFFGAHCDQASFQAGTCPASTVVGSATASSPLLSQPLSGPVSLVDGGGAFPNLGLDLRGQLHLLLQGTTDISNGNTVSFHGLPDIPISRFELTFPSSPGLLGAARDLCQPPPPMFHADFSGYNGASTAVDSAATVDGCGGVAGKCAKAKKHKKKHHRAAESKKKHKKKSCKKKKKHKKHR
jgi:hypothetical protein